MKRVEYMKVTKFLLITFAISWSCFGLLVFLNNTGVTSYSSPSGFALVLIGAFAPAIVALAMQESRTPRAIAKFIFSGNYRPWPYLLLFGLLLGVAFWFPTRELNPDGPPGLWAFPVVLLMMTVGGGGQEEIGWQGFLRPALEKYMPFPAAVVLFGVIWAIWHLPLWFIEGSFQQNIHFGVYIIMALVYAFPISVIHKKTQNVFYSCVMHGLINTFAAYFAFGEQWLLIFGGEVMNLPVVLGGALVVIASLLVWYVDKRKA